MTVEGDTVVAGAYGDDGANDDATDSGSAYVFTKDAGGWGQAAKLAASDAAAGDRFGVSVAVDSDTAVVGAYLDDHTYVNAGSAYVFTKDTLGGWGQAAKLIASDAAGGDWFGWSVAVDADAVVVGVHRDDDHGAGSGSAYVFLQPSTGWADRNERAKLAASDARGGDNFGWSVAVDAGTVVVGARYDDDTPNGFGVCLCFRRLGVGGHHGERSGDHLASGDRPDQRQILYLLGAGGERQRHRPGLVSRLGYTV